jgi:hypothetical protein
MTAAPRRRASVSVDLDDCWTYWRTRGRADWQDAPSFLPLAIERAMATLERHDLRATFFIIGRDAGRAELAASLAAITRAGHEVANHSLNHQPWFHLFGDAEIEREIVEAEDAIAAATGQRPRGFRGPGHSVTDAARRILVARGYLYDASPLPTYVMPLVRWLYFRDVALSPEQRRERGRLGGDFAAGFASNRPRCRQLDASRLVEIPVTTFPGVRLPIHFTYLQYLNRRSPRLASSYFAAAIAACRATSGEPSLLLHATDFLGNEDRLPLEFFPGMEIAVARKLALVDSALALVARRFSLGPLIDHARAVLARGATGPASRAAVQA